MIVIATRAHTPAAKLPELFVCPPVADANAGIAPSDAVPIQKVVLFPELRNRITSENAAVDAVRYAQKVTVQLVVSTAPLLVRSQKSPAVANLTAMPNP